jgi:hypothetical protein
MVIVDEEDPISNVPVLPILFVVIVSAFVVIL